MKTVKVSFDYEGRHYEVKCSVKRNIKKHEWELTGHKWNDDILFTNYEEDKYYSIFHCDDYVELEVSHDFRDIKNVLLWSKDDNNGCIIAALREFENFKKNIGGAY